jgi:hypothetical protein
MHHSLGQQKAALVKKRVASDVQSVGLVAHQATTNGELIVKEG